MAIELRSPQEAYLYAQAGKVIGEAQRRKEEAQRAQEIADRLRTFEMQKEMTLFNQQLELDRMKFARQMDFEDEKRARVWQLEKMDIASRNDFMQEEAKRTQRFAEYDTGMKYIAENADSFPPGFREQAEFNLYFDKILNAPGVNYPSAIKESTKPFITPEREIGYLGMGYTPEEIQTKYQYPVSAQATTSQFAQQAAVSKGMPVVKNDTDYDALPSNTAFIDPEGQVRIKL